MKFDKNFTIIYFCLRNILASYVPLTGRQFFDYEDGIHTIIIPLEPGTKIISYQLHEKKSNGLNSSLSIHQGAFFELTRYYLIIDLTKFTEESDTVYDIRVCDDTDNYDWTYPFKFNREKNKFEIVKYQYKKNWLKQYGSHIGIALGAGFGAVVMHFLLK